MTTGSFTSAQSFLPLLLAALALPGCATIEVTACGNQNPVTVHTGLERSAEDIVALPMPGATTRLLTREACQGRASCETSDNRIGFFDVDPALLGTSAEPAQARQTRHWWRPPRSFDGGRFKPLGLSLIEGPVAGDGALFIIDRGDPFRIWKVEIKGGDPAPDSVREAFAPWFLSSDERFGAANDLHAAAGGAHVTRFSLAGFLPSGSDDWDGILAIREGSAPTTLERGLRGANGIVALPGARTLAVSDYWGKRLRFVALDGRPSAAKAVTLPIRPDNLTLREDTLYIAGQRYLVPTILNLAFPGFASPSEVYAARVDEDGLKGTPTLLWSGGWDVGRSVSVAVPVPGGLALGQITAPDLLLVRCD